MSGKEHGDLLTIVRHVRRRWRLKLALRGATTVLGLGALLLVTAAYGLQWSRFNPVAIISSRLVFGVALLAIIGYFLVRPLLRRVSDEQVALYLEEHEPKLEAAIISAVEASTHGGQTAQITEDSRSPALIARLVESAIERCVTTRAPLQVEKQTLARYAAGAVVILLLVFAIFGAGPAYLRQGLSALLVISRDVEAAAPYRIEVTPGDVTIPKGADQSVVAKLKGFSANDVTLFIRKGAGTQFEKLPLMAGSSGSFDGMLFDVVTPTEYFVEAEGVQSKHFSIKVVDLPYVQQLKLEYRFPAYTGLEPQVVENGGDIAVLAGTQVRLHVTPTMRTTGGRVALNEKQQVPLTLAADGTLDGTFTATVDGFYRIELDAPTGEHVAASPQYTIDVLADQPPHVSFAKPGRDTTASPIEEVYVETQASDDYGVRDLELVYSVNGGDAKSVKLFGGDRRLAQVSAGHTFYLEEFNVHPGDSVSYYASASDNNAVAGAKKATSDIYFLRIRPFKKDFRAAQSMAGGGGGGAGGSMNDVNALSEQERQIIAATFNVQRDRKEYPPDKLKEKTVIVALSQSRLREQVEGLMTRMTSRFVEQDPAFKKIVDLMPKAIAEMKAAEAKLAVVSPDGALPPENRALQFLQKAEEEYETQVTSSRGGGGGGASGNTGMARELAEMFEMDLDKLANQYETADRAMQQSADQQIDELMEKLKELARRQEQEAEQLRRRQLAGQMNSATAGSQQRALAEQAEEAARRLEKLSREQNRPDLADSARQMRDVADAMRRAGASGSQSAAQAASALERLRETQRRLERMQSDRSKRQIDDAQRQAEDIARDQRAISDEVGRLQQRTGDARRQSLADLDSRKGALDAKIGELEKQLDRSAAQTGHDDKDAARKMADAANSIRDTRLRDKVRYSRQMLGRAGRETMDTVEHDIADSIDAMRRKIDQAATSAGTQKPDQKENTVDRAQRLARGMESLEQRLRERLDRTNRRADSQQGQTARGSQGKDSDQAQSGPPGNQAQRGQGQQGQSGGRPGSQQGQGQQASAGADSQGGTPSGGRAGGDNFAGGTFGDPRGGYGYGGWDGTWRGYLSPEDVRQFRGEVRQWLNEAADLRRRLTAENVDPKDLDEILRRLRQLDDDRIYRDASELQRLQTFVTDGMKRFEYSLRRQTEQKDKEVVLSGADEVPDAFRPLVEQYYRSLSKGASR
jgi:hypothetical protein